MFDLNGIRPVIKKEDAQAYNKHGYIPVASKDKYGDNWELFDRHLKEFDADLKQLSKFHQPQYNMISFCWGMIIGTGVGIVIMLLIRS